MAVVAQKIVGIAYMVGMVVSEQQRLYPAHGYAVDFKHFLYLVGPDSGIDDNPFAVGADITAVST